MPPKFLYVLIQSASAVKIILNITGRDTAIETIYSEATNRPSGEECQQQYSSPSRTVTVIVCPAGISPASIFLAMSVSTALCR